MLKVVADGKWAEVDEPEEAAEELPPGTKFWNPEYGRCISLVLRKTRDGHRRFWFFSHESECGMKVYGCGTGPFMFKIATRHAEDPWPPVNSIDWRGDPI